jgi:choice-of-anchor C domain-containing protein
MKKYIVLMSCAFVFAGSIWFKAEASTSLIKDGGFEEAQGLSGGIAGYDVGSTGLPGWAVVNHGIEALTNPPYWTASEGEISLDLNGVSGPGGVSQSFATVPGAKYSVWFDMGGNWQAPQVYTMSVEANGKSNDYSGSYNFDAVTYKNWSTQSFDFTADSGLTELKFLSTSTANPAAGPALDNVIVTGPAAPEPVSCALFLLGSGALAIARRKKS